ncbi:MAG: hypothetical protein HY089_05735, partial [Ignavibacteriales bacterium]|nr:hypothetical protein [Ignavibacteriales bacterium]
MRFTRSFSIILFITTLVHAQQLPMGEFHPNRERTYDITHYKANLQIDWKNKKISGEATITFHSLTDASSFSLDAYWLSIASVQEYPSRSNLKFTSTDSTLIFSFNRALRTTDTVSVVIQYSATPTAGLYFVDSPAGSTMLPSIYTYGEGGLHANWLPVYNDTNDKFSTEMT